MSPHSMTEQEAREFLQLAHTSPQRTLVEVRKVLDDESEPTSAVRSVLNRAMALAARNADDQFRSSEYARSALSHAETSGDQGLMTEALLTLSGSEAIEGRNESALAHLDRARDLASGKQKADVLFQLGTIRARMGETVEARELFSEALPVFFECDDTESIAMTLHNRGMLSLSAGDLDQALEDFHRAKDLYVQLDLNTSLAGVEHNIGLAFAHSGDLPRSLAILDHTEALYRELGSPVSEIQVSRVEVLMAAGLFDEARRLAEHLATDLGRLGLGEDQAEAVLAGAVAAHLSGESSDAVEAARRAASMFKEQSRDAWYRKALRVELASRLDMGALEPDDLRRAIELADSLGAYEQSDASFDAKMTAGLIALELGDREEARRALRSVARAQTGPVQRRLTGSLARALLLDLDGDAEGAELAARSGMALLDDYHTVLGAGDVRAGVEKHARQLAELGLRLAIRGGDQVRVFEWMELARARSIRHRSVRPPADADQAADLRSLRGVELALRKPQAAEVAEFHARKLLLEESIKNRSRHALGTGERVRESSPSEVLDGLGDSTLVEYAEFDGQLWRLTAIDGELASRPVGLVAQLEREISRLRFSMRFLARGRGSRTRVESELDNLSSWLLTELTMPPGGLVVLVPTPSMYALPWSSLPAFDGLSVVVAPSAEMYVSRSTPAVERRRSVGAAIAVGPDLEYAAEEARSVASVYSPQPPVSQTVEDVIAMMGVSSTAHFVCHASFAADNPMFSSLRLADGDLYVYDMERLETVPDVVVLSACDSGFTDAQPGKELLGLSAALLGMGAKSVIATVGLLPDTLATIGLMTELHRGLAAGLAPSVALRDAQNGVIGLPGGYISAASFICIGAG